VLRLDDPPSIAELCIAVAAKQRALYLKCVEAFGRPQRRCSPNFGSMRCTGLYPVVRKGRVSPQWPHATVLSILDALLRSTDDSSGELPSVTFAGCAGGLAAI
jgi:hypothetical protein